MSSKTLPPSASASSSQLATTSDKGSVACTACVDAAARFRTRSGSGAFHKSSFTIRSDQRSTWRGAASTMSLYLWALERHGLQAAYAPLVSQAVAFE